jgi:glucosamine-6-phosphate deaminase
MKICVAETRAELGKLAARDIARALLAGLREKANIRMILAAAPSQSDMLEALLREPGIDWSRVTAFHMDEYIGLPATASQGFGQWLKQAFFDHIPLAKVHLIEPGNNPESACHAYAEKLVEAPIDLVLLGIGINGHLAFNDPPANFDDPLAVKVVELDEMCRQQQVLDGCFAAFNDVPIQAITLTVPTLLSGRQLFCSVPGIHKSDAVKAMIEAPINGACPATALRTHPQCTVYLDRESSSKINPHAHSSNLRS